MRQQFCLLRAIGTEVVKSGQHRHLLLAGTLGRDSGNGLGHGRRKGRLVGLTFHPIQKGGKERKGAHGLLDRLHREQAGDGTGVAKDGTDEAGSIGIADGGLAAGLEIWENGLGARAGIGQQLHETKLGILRNIDQGRRRMRGSSSTHGLCFNYYLWLENAGKNAVLKIQERDRSPHKMCLILRLNDPSMEQYVNIANERGLQRRVLFQTIVKREERPVQ